MKCKPITILAVLFCLIMSLNKGLAQCKLKVVKTATGYITQTPESYWYLRDTQKYDALAIRAVRRNVSGKKQIRISVKYTSSVMADLKTLKFITPDTCLLITALIPSGKQIIDAPELNTRIYEINLSMADIKFLTLYPLKGVEINSNTQQNQIRIPVYDPSFLIQQLSCLQKQ